MLFIKWNVAIFLLTFNFTTYASVPISQQEKLEKTRYFSIGMNGFTGKMSEGEKIYRKITKDSDAENTFIDIFKNKKSTNEAKLYAACGLHTLNPKRLNSLHDENNTEYVTLLQGDILYKKRFNEVIKSITSHGCN